MTNTTVIKNFRETIRLALAAIILISVLAILLSHTHIDHTDAVETDVSAIVPIGILIVFAIGLMTLVKPQRETQSDAHWDSRSNP
ncbi:MAG: hypothetical protein A2846_03385 [Candidatus Doudnabacteria bacterium RIFCSPHIGHO2_01_FULL_49_9]|nr:MAG: hypothetical protein A2846_03385 [Candidatus Doudnabacteria bacterium RIFCSPHIGHO2_01_FULL_49_9]